MPFTNTDVTFTVAFEYTSAERRSGVVRLTYDTDMLAALTANGYGSLSNVTADFSMIKVDDGFTLKLANPAAPYTTAGNSTSSPFPLPLTASAFPTVQTGTYGFTLVVTLTGGTSPGTYTSDSYEEILCADIPTLVQDIEVDCACAAISSTDTTNYATGGWTVLSREMRLDPPAPQDLTHSPITSTTTTVSNTGENLWIGTYTFTLTVTIQKTLSGIGTVQITMINIVNQQVICVDLCKMICGLNTRFAAYEYAVRGGSWAEFPKIWEQIEKASLVYQLALSNVNCAPEKVNDLTAKFWTYLGIDPSCSPCGSSNTPSAVVPTCGNSGGGGGTTYTFGTTLAAGDYFTLTEAAGVVTFGLTAKGTGILAAIKNYVVDSPDGSVDVTFTDAIGVIGTRTYHVQVDAQSKALNSYEVLANLNTTTGVFSFVGSPVTKGSLFLTTNPTITLQGDGITWLVSNFLVGAATKIYPTVTMTAHDRKSGMAAYYDYYRVDLGEYGALTASESSFSFRFFWSSANYIALGLPQLSQSSNTIQVLIKIEA